MNAGDTFADNATVEYVMENKDEDAELIYGSHRLRQAESPKKEIHRELWYRTMPFCHQTLFVRLDIMKQSPFDTQYKLAADHAFVIKMYEENKKIHNIKRTIAIFTEGGFADSNLLLMYIESLKILLHSKASKKDIENSWWYLELTKKLSYDVSLLASKRSEWIKKQEKMIEEADVHAKKQSAWIKKQEKMIEEADVHAKKQSEWIKKVEKEKKQLESIYVSMGKLINISTVRHPLQKFRAYKEAVSSHDKARLALQKKSVHLSVKKSSPSMFKKIIKKAILYDRLKMLKQKLIRKYGYIFYKKVDGYQKYTVVSAVYNVERYLEMYFKSVANQTLKFEEHIFLVMVDDGSTDSSAKIIKRWQAKFPNNITYIKKENAGQASARNFGMEYVKTPWVTFIDPDDFIDFRYFEKIDRFLKNNKKQEPALISCNLIFYYEDQKQFSNSHPLKYRFKKGNQIIENCKLNTEIQLSASTAIFRTNIIQESRLAFSIRIRPSFEDAYFVGEYLLSIGDNENICFLPKAKYYYRKRAIKTSTSDTGWQDPATFDAMVEYGLLGLLKEAKEKKGAVPIVIQRTVLYHILWHYKIIINNNGKVNFLNTLQIQKYKELLVEIFHLIDTSTIMSHSIAGCQYYHKVGLLQLYKNSKPSSQTVYVTNYDAVKKMVQLKYFSGNKENIAILLNDKTVDPIFKKIRRHTFLNELFVYEYILWIQLKGSNEQLITVRADCPVNLSMSGMQYEGGIASTQIFHSTPVNDTHYPLHIRLKRKLTQSSLVAKKFAHAWLFMDRAMHADDNAEHLYRYVAQNHPKINVFFVLDRRSPDWNRLKDEGFRLLAINSYLHKLAYAHADHLISSHTDLNASSYIPVRWFGDLLHSKYTFLQHGVTHNDVSTWLNTKKIDCFIVTARREYDYLAVLPNQFKFTPKEVVLSGFPRYDSLLSGDNKKEKVILIMPTWRQALVKGLKERFSDDSRRLYFSNSVYAQHWKTLLHSDKLALLSKQYGYRVIFFPHANIQNYINLFNIPSYIEIILHSSKSIQHLFRQAALMITDYSSVSFEMGMLRRAVIYYQFDYELFFNKEHTLEAGYFDYEKDGFGPVCHKEEELLCALEKFLKTGGSIDSKYIKRMQEFFAFHDTNNCKRTFEAIQKLDKTDREISAL
jgi:glycosyltransferase involved in cell wall biosynthesis/CDP-glycerol glycerophosphotransferase (TagB/SpsB family)